MNTLKRVDMQKSVEKTTFKFKTKKALFGYFLIF